jgi:hypothetical protein
VLPSTPHAERIYDACLTHTLLHQRICVDAHHIPSSHGVRLQKKGGEKMEKNAPRVRFASYHPTRETLKRARLCTLLSPLDGQEKVGYE